MSTGETDPVGLGPTWRELFPVSKYVVTGLESPFVAQASEREIIDITRAMAVAIVDDRPATPLKTLFPALGRGGRIPWDRFGTRERNALLRRGVQTLPELSEWTVKELLDLPGVGSGTAIALMQSLAEHSLECALSEPINSVSASIETDTGAHADGVEIDQELGVDELLAVLERDIAAEGRRAVRALIQADMETVAGWHVLRGASSTPVLAQEGLAEAPEHVRLARERIFALTVDELVDVSAARPAAILEQHLSSLEPREVTVLQQRTFADDPLTLDALGQRLGVTRERVRQIEKKAGEILTAWLAEGPVADLAAAVRSRIGTVCSLDHLLSVFPALTETVPTAGQPVWRVVDRLDARFEIHDGWATVPCVSTVREMTRSSAARAVGELGAAELQDVAAEVGMSDSTRRDELVGWLTYCDCVVFGDYVSARQFSIPDWAALILNQASEPLSVDEIAERMPVDRAGSSIRNALAVDERFVRADRDTFALAAWGGPAYAGIRDAIGRAIDAGGGAVDLAALVGDLTTQFTVAESSVRAYAQAHPFVTMDGKVRRRETTTIPAVNPSGTRRLYRLSDGWALRLQVTADHARGSGSVLPTTLAVLLGLSQGDSLTIPSPDGAQSMYWTGLQPSLGSVRRLLELNGLTDGDWACAVFDDAGSFSLVPIHADGRTGVALALALAGIPDAGVADPRELLARAMSLPLTSSWSSIIAAARNRGDDDVVEALLADPDVGAAATGASATTSSPVSGSTVDEILDLL